VAQHRDAGQLEDAAKKEAAETRLEPIGSENIFNFLEGEANAELKLPTSIDESAKLVKVSDVGRRIGIVKLTKVRNYHTCTIICSIRAVGRVSGRNGRRAHAGKRKAGECAPRTVIEQVEHTKARLEIESFASELDRPRKTQISRKSAFEWVRRPDPIRGSREGRLLLQ
jgi:hypothetical protein